MSQEQFVATAPGASEGVVYQRLRRQAEQLLRGERRNHTLSATALVHESFVRLTEGGYCGSSLHEVLCLATRAMREVLVDYARARRTQKRGGEAVRVPLHESLCVEGADPDELLAVHEALTGLQEVDPDLSQLVELRYFGGLSEGEVGALLGISKRTVQREWRIARLWLLREIAGEVRT